jgi:hypothetical protein
MNGSELEDLFKEYIQGVYENLHEDVIVGSISLEDAKLIGTRIFQTTWVKDSEYTSPLDGSSITEQDIKNMVDDENNVLESWECSF